MYSIAKMDITNYKSMKEVLNDGSADLKSQDASGKIFYLRIQSSLLNPWRIYSFSPLSFSKVRPGYPRTILGPDINSLIHPALKGHQSILNQSILV
jgi:hypothetical protein